MIHLPALRLVALLGVLTAVSVGLPVTTTASASTVTAREVRKYVPVGDAVQGSSSPAGAPALKPGQYTDKLGPDEQKHYTITLADGVSPYFTATVIRPPGVLTDVTGDYESFTDTVDIAISTAAGDDCGSDDASTSQGTSVTPFSGVARPGRVGTGWGGPFSGPGGCGRPGKYVVSVTRTQSSAIIPRDELPMEIVYIAEPPLSDDVSSLPKQQPVSTSSLAPDVTAAASAVKGAGGFSEATVLGKSGSYTDNIKPGETLYYRIKLGQGQRIGYTVRFTGQKSLDEAISVGASLATPYRGLVVDSNDEGTYTSSNDEKVSGQMAAPVAYRNRESDLDAVEQLSLGGYYYLIVTMANSTSETTAEVPINIAVRLAGKAADSPKYRKVDGTSNLDDLGLPGQESPGLTIRKVAYLAGGGLALTLAVLVLLVPLLRRRS